MKRPARRGAVPAVVAILALAGGLGACGGGSSLSAAPALPTPTSVPTTPASSDVPSAALEVTAESVAFAPTVLVGPAAAPFTITMNNRDAGIPHGIAIRPGLPVNGVAPTAPDLFVGKIVAGPAATRYAVPALPAGAYTFFCQVHPNMLGSLTLRQP